MTIRILSLCSGYGGLEMGLDAYFTAHGYATKVIAHCDLDQHARRVLYANSRGTGVYTGVDLLDDTILPTRSYDILTAGFPCQPVSVAGKQRTTDDERWLIDDIAARYLTNQRPPLAIFENVPGLLNYGRRPDGETAMGRVLSALADAGYDARWCTVAASDAGACHRRERVFIAATPTDPDGVPVWAEPFRIT